MVTGSRRHGLEDALKSSRWIGNSLSSARLAVLGRLGQDHVDHDRQALVGVEHAFGAAQADADGAVTDGAFCASCGRVGIGQDLDPGDLVGPDSRVASSSENSASIIGTSPR